MSLLDCPYYSATSRPCCDSLGVACQCACHDGQRAMAVATTLAHRMLEGRRGHGNAPAAKRVLDLGDLREALRTAALLAQRRMRIGAPAPAVPAPRRASIGTPVERGLA